MMTCREPHQSDALIFHWCVVPLHMGSPKPVKGSKRRSFVPSIAPHHIIIILTMIRLLQTRSAAVSSNAGSASVCGGTLLPQFQNLAAYH